MEIIINIIIMKSIIISIVIIVDNIIIIQINLNRERSGISIVLIETIVLS